MKNSQHLGFWLLLAALGFFIAPMLRTTDEMDSFLRTEVQQTRLAMGDRLGGLVTSFANGLFSNTPLAMLAGELKAAQHTKAEQELGARVAGPVGEFASQVHNGYLKRMVKQAYVVAMRFAIVVFWLVALLPVFVAAVYDGLMLRSVKLAEFGSMRPATFTLAGLIVIPVLALPLLYLTLPFHMSPLLAPAWAALVALPLSLLVSNSQPLFGR